MPAPEPHRNNQDELEPVTSLSRTWPVKILGLLLAIVAVCLIAETVAVLLNLPENTPESISRLR
jgi:hypothetical protein